MNTEHQNQDKAPVCKELEGKYLTFSLGSEEYGVEILRVKEIIGMMDITEVPDTPEYVKGVINLRGKVIPVMDLRSRFMMGQVDYTERTCIVVFETKTDGGVELVGVIVDGVSEVLHIKGKDIELIKELGGGMHVRSDYILGMAKNEKSVRILLDIDRVASFGHLSH